MSQSSVKKRRQKRIKNAMARSETVYRKAMGKYFSNANRAPGIEDEAEYFARTGQLFPLEMPESKEFVYLEKPAKGSDEGPKVVCTCGEFEFGPSTNLMTLGLRGKRHATETGHQLRSHNG